VNNLLFAIFTQDGNTPRASTFLRPHGGGAHILFHSKGREAHLRSGERALECPPHSLHYDDDKWEPWLAQVSSLDWVSRLAWCCYLTWVPSRIASLAWGSSLVSCCSLA